MEAKRAKQENRESRPGLSRRKLGLSALAAVLATGLLLSGCGSSGANDDSANSGTESSNATSTGDGAKGGDTAASEDSGEHVKTDEGNATTKDSGVDDGASDSGDKAAPGESGTVDPEKMPSDTDGNSQYDPSKPGQLTAGEWNDLLAWKPWLKLVDSEDGRYNQWFWSMHPQRRVEVDVTADGKPVGDAEVVLTDSVGDTVWEARTDNRGVAYVYAGFFDEQEQGEPKRDDRNEGDRSGGDRMQTESSQGQTYGITVTSGEQEKRFENVPVPRAQALKVAFEQKAESAKALDLMLVVDTTNSMQDELRYLQTELMDVVKRVDKDNGQKLAIRASANFYRDHGDDYVVKAYPFRTDIGQVVQELSSQKAAGGGDFPEAADEALDNAINDHEWSDEARARLLFLVMDAPPHRERKVTKRLRELTEDAAADGIRIIPVASSGVDAHTEYLMRFLASATGGTYLFLTDHSGIGNSHEKPAVGEYEVRALNDLLVEVINRYSAQ